MQLSTCSFFGDFLLLDPCDAEAVHNFISDKDKVKERSVTHKASMPRMNAQSSLHSPSEEKSAVKSHKPTGMKQGVAFDQPFESNFASGVGLNDTSPGPSAGHDSPGNNGDHQDEPEFGYPDINDDSDEDDDPWKPLNPHEAGNLRIKPFKRCMLTLSLIFKDVVLVHIIMVVSHLNQVVFLEGSLQVSTSVNLLLCNSQWPNWMGLLILN